MLLQTEMLQQKDFVACKVKTLALENYELKVQNSKLWQTIERQRDAFGKAQEEIDEDREESERLLEELATENERLRELLRTHEAFHGASLQEQIREAIKSAEKQVASEDNQAKEGLSQGAVDVQSMVSEASAQIRRQSEQRKLEKKRTEEETNTPSNSAPVNGKRSI